MTLIQFIRLLNKNLRLLVMSSVLLALFTFLFTMNLPKEFQSETEIYTGLASGVNVTDVAKSTVDFFSTNNAFDNLMNIIKSRQTLEETGERLLALHLVYGKEDPRLLTAESFAQLDQWLPPSDRKELTVEDNVEATFERIRRFKLENSTSQQIKDIFYNERSPYSYKSIQSINPYRIGNSDLIKIGYKWSDAGICQKTLEILNDVFTRRMAEIKLGQSNDVVLYFRRQVDEAMKRLQTAEERLKNFRTQNRIINYTEQTKSIAMMKEYLEDEYQKEMAIRASAEASLRKLEKQLEMNREIVKFSDQILAKRTELAEISSKIASMEVYYQNEEELQVLREKQETLKAELSNHLTKRFEYGRTTDGVQVKDLLAEWLKYTLMLDESNARIRVFQNRKEYFMKLYDEFSPLGSRIAQMEREIGIEEKNYLQQLHSLNQAMLKQKGEALASGGLVVTVPPFYPLEPLASKRVFLILVSLSIGFVLPLVVIILLDYLDQTIRTPMRAQKLTGLTLLGAYPNMEDPSAQKEGLDLERMSNLAVGLLCQNLLLEVKKLGIQSKQPLMVAVFSTEPGDGKSRVTHEMANELTLLGFNVMVMRYKEADADDEFLYTQNLFPIDRAYLNTHAPEQIMESGYDLRDYDFVFVQIPALLQSRYPVDLMEKMDVAFMTVKATRVWRKADGHSLLEICDVLKVKPRIVLNGVAPEDMEEVIGEVAKRRSALRKLLKRILTLQIRFRKGYKGNPLF